MLYFPFLHFSHLLFFFSQIPKLFHTFLIFYIFFTFSHFLHFLHFLHFSQHLYFLFNFFLILTFFLIHRLRGPVRLRLALLMIRASTRSPVTCSNDGVLDSLLPSGFRWLVRSASSSKVLRSIASRMFGCIDTAK